MKRFFKIFFITIAFPLACSSNDNKGLPDSLSSEEEYLLAAQNYIQLRNINAAENILNVGLKQLNNSAAIHNELGEIYFTQNKKKEAIESWENGISKNDSYKNNFYNAAMYYRQNNPLKVIQYAEYYLLLGDSSTKAIDMKLALVEAYKSILTAPLALKMDSDFDTSLYSFIKKNRAEFNFKNICLLRTKLLLSCDNQNKEASIFNTLFYKLRKLWVNGFSETYHQALFNLIINPTEYKKWADTHRLEIKNLQTFFNNNPF